MLRPKALFLPAFYLAESLAAATTQVDVNSIVKRSVVANEANWKAAPNYAYVERDVEQKGGKKTVKTYQVFMIEGSTYNKVISIDDRPLSKAQQAQEEAKLRKEIERRKHESPSGRAKRTAEYNKEREQDHAMMREMAEAFSYKLAGTQTINGHEAWVLEASPRPGYQCKSHMTKVLTGMRGNLWVDKKDYQWVKVEAEVFKPVSFGLFIAKVKPGTRFTLEQSPVSGNVWMPHHFRVDLSTSILGYSRNSVDDETYRDYRPNSIAPVARASANHGHQ